MFDIPRHGSLVSRNSSSVTHPPPTRTITVLFKNRTNRMFCFSPNYSTRNGAHSAKFYETYNICRGKKTDPKTCTQTPREEKKSAGVYFLSHSIQNESIFSVFLVLYIATINRREQKRNIRQIDCHRMKILEHYTNLTPVKKDVVCYTRYLPSSIISARNEFLH